MRMPMPTFPKVDIPTPFGRVNLPQARPLVISRPTIDGRRMKALKHAVGYDLANIVIGFIPTVGDVIGEKIGDLHYYAMRQILTPEEVLKFEEMDRKIPSNVGALLYSFVKGA